MIVVDTNIIAYLYITGKYSEQAAALLAKDSDWHSPRLWRSELRNVLSLYLRKKLLSFDDALVIMQQAESLLSNNEYEISSTSIMQLVQTSSCSAYDCEFIALAKYLNVSLLTSDKKIIKEFSDTAINLEHYVA